MLVRDASTLLFELPGLLCVVVVFTRVPEDVVVPVRKFEPPAPPDAPTFIRVLLSMAL